MTPKFKPGDPVWAQSNGKEVPAIVDRLQLYTCDGCKGFRYDIIEHLGLVGACEIYLRPRRDDYQQHEPRGSREKLTDKLSPEERSKVMGEMLQDSGLLEKLRKVKLI